MTETATTPAAARPSGALSTMRVAELQTLAAELGISGASKLRKPELVAAIRERRGGARPAAATTSAPAASEAPARQDSQPTTTHHDTRIDDVSPSSERTPVRDARQDAEPVHTDGAGEQPGRRRSRRAVSAPAGAPTPREERPSERSRSDSSAAAVNLQPSERTQALAEELREPQRPRDEQPEGDARPRRERTNDRGARADRSERPVRDNGTNQGQNQQDRQQGQNQQDRPRGGQQNERQQGTSQQSNGQRQNGTDRPQYRQDDEDGSGRRRGRQRNRDRKRRGRGEDFVADVEQYGDDDVLVPVAGILDMDNNYAFVRTSGYLPGPSDVYVPMNLAKKSGLRKGDAIVGAVKAQREDQPQQQQGKHAKFNALVRLDTVNGMTVEQARTRVEFGKLTPLYPQERLRLETTPSGLTTRIIDLVAPVGKGQRGLIVAPAKAGKTMVMQAIANAITTNSPECHLMVVLVDERPEEVTDMQRAVKGEVIASTFDRPASDHTTVAELAIERAKRLVEMGHDVVVLLDSITKLGRAYNLAAPASGRILSGGVDANALYPPKRFFGAARNIEHGGSLTILATALVETGSKMDDVIFEEFKGTGNMELKLDRQLANRRIFPAVDVNSSSTRREEILLSAEELKIMWKLRRVLAALDQQAGIELLVDRLKKTKSNVEFLMQVQKSTPVPGLDDED